MDFWMFCGTGCQPASFLPALSPVLNLPHDLTPTAMPRYVILRHDSPRGIHFDFMLEAGETLKTWALPEPPRPEVEMPCEALGDHRLAYLDYQGPISGGRGSVTRWDSGTFTVESHGEAEWIINLAGEKLSGRAILRQNPDVLGQWYFSFAEEKQG
jgi:hypothetical protein